MDPLCTLTKIGNPKISLGHGQGKPFLGTQCLDLGLRVKNECGRKIRHCAATFSLKVPKACTDLDLTIKNTCQILYEKIKC